MADETVSLSERRKEDWMNAKWRPLMGWMYMLVCTMDFVVFPILWSIHQSVSNGNVSAQWTPLTLQGAGLFHMAMGAVIGVAAFGRTQEKLAGVSMPPMPTPTPTPTPTIPTVAPIVKPMPKPMPPSADDFAEPPVRNTRND
jgi:hypothetical protein